jgi:hypothetical protein
MTVPKKSLLESALVFLKESLRSFRSGSLTFAILHVTTAVELVLKERLARVHPNLIFKTLDSEKLDRSKTVGLYELPFRLSHFGVQTSESELATIRDVAKWRNEIVHHTPTYERQSAIARLGEIYDFLASFLVHQLKVDLKSVISADLYKTANELLSEWKLVIAEARGRATESGEMLRSEICPACGADGVLTEDGDGTIQCHLFGETLKSGTCPICNKPALGYPGWDDEVYHDDCLADVGADYAAEMRRNK